VLLRQPSVGCRIANATRLNGRFWRKAVVRIMSGYGTAVMAQIRHRPNIRFSEYGLAFRCRCCCRHIAVWSVLQALPAGAKLADNFKKKDRESG